MASPLDNLPETDKEMGVLVVSASRQDHISLQKILSHTDWMFHGARNRREALDVLKSHRIGVILCERSLPDGTWKDLHESLSLMPAPPLLIVSSIHANSSLWGEVLNLGAHDVVARPFDEAEVIRVVTLAWLSWNEAMARRTQTGSTNVTGNAA